MELPGDTVVLKSLPANAGMQGTQEMRFDPWVMKISW